ncbi:uncharacterized protein [Dermacentor andersoni]|uniref:uncharacterized protein isoform X1 n=1 Tax=Dermacentor andersoni TaxID=34620 RepID=UPI0024165AE6|nr:uncharacterized protein LOC126533419 isoform X1 [Dermacentor andersoni]
MCAYPVCHPSVVPPHLRHRHEEGSALHPRLYGKYRLSLCLIPLGFLGIIGVAYLMAIPESRTPSGTQNSTPLAAFTSAAPSAVSPGRPFPRYRYVARPGMFDAPRVFVTTTPPDNGITTSEVAKVSWAAHVPRKPMWCFFDSKDFTYTVSSLPLELCSAIIFCCLDLSPRGDSVAVLAADEERYRDIAERRKAYPWVRLFVGVGGPRAMEEGFRVLSSPNVTNMTVVRLCRSLHKFAERMGGEGVLFHPPASTDGAYHQFIVNLQECLGAFDIEVSVVIPEDAIDDRAFVKYEAYYRLLKNVVVWAHIPNMSHVTCAFDGSFFEPWFEWLKRKPLSVATKSLLSLSLAPLRYPMPPAQAGRNCFRKESAINPQRVPFAQVCLRVADMTAEEPLPRTACHVYHDLHDCYVTFSSKALSAIGPLSRDVSRMARDRRSVASSHVSMGSRATSQKQGLIRSSLFPRDSLYCSLPGVEADLSLVKHPDSQVYGNDD